MTYALIAYAIITLFFGFAIAWKNKELFKKEWPETTLILLIFMLLWPVILIPAVIVMTIKTVKGE